MRVTFTSHRTPLLVAGLALVLATLSLLTGVSRALDVELPGGDIAVRLFDMDAERNFPTWVATVTLALCALVLWTAAQDARPDARLSRGWYVLSAAFSLMSMDEALSFHERGSVALRAALDTSGLLRHAWIIVAVPLLAAFLLCLIPFLRRLSATTRRGLLLAGLVYVSGAVGLEAVGGLLTRPGDESVLAAAVTTVEETLELLGMALLLHVLGRHQARSPAPVLGRHGIPLPRSSQLSMRKGDPASDMTGGRGRLSRLVG